MSKSYYNFGIKRFFVAWFKCASMTHPSLKSASSLYQRQCNSFLPHPFIFLSSVEPLPTKIETSSISSITFEVFPVCHLKICLWTLLPWVHHEILDFRRSIFLELFPLFFNAAEQQCQMKKMKLRDVMNQSLRERRSSWDQQDRWRLVYPCFLLSCTTLWISGRDSCKGIDL
jgi:hypothetical protein